MTNARIRFESTVLYVYIKNVRVLHVITQLIYYLSIIRQILFDEILIRISEKKPPPFDKYLIVNYLLVSYVTRQSYNSRVDVRMYITSSKSRENWIHLPTQNV